MTTMIANTPRPTVARQRRALHVVFGVRADWQRNPGGDSVQIASTAAELARLGVQVTICPDPRADLRGFDLMHLFHLWRVHESYPHFRNAVAAGLPVVLSTIYWTQPHVRCAPWAGRLWRELCEDAKNLARSVLVPSGRRGALQAATLGFGRCQRRLARGARMLLPNSQVELDLIRDRFGADLPGRAVCNGVSTAACRLAMDGDDPARQRQVLCVGHFDPRKNQAALVEAMRDTDVPVIFIGRARPMHMSYFRRCRRRAGPNMRFIGELDGAQVLAWMAGSRTLAMPSHFETPGLAALEAAAMGCALAVGDCPPVREYFRDDVLYFPPADTALMRRAVLAALEEPAPPSLAQRVMDGLDWSVAARQTLEAYHAAMQA